MKMSMELEVDVTFTISRGSKGYSGCRRGVVGLWDNPSPPEPPEIEDLTVTFKGIDITEHVDLGPIEDAIWDSIS